uniref:Uncharacterized protein n=1 Tax=Arundo donax TaxID=35708 RepID=A0A0A9HHR1_ARUDO
MVSPARSRALGFRFGKRPYY